MKAIDRVFSKLALPILGIAGVLLILTIVLSTKQATSENNGYIRVINCVISIPATLRTQEDIERCYKTVENDLGIKLQRYDTSSYRQ